MAEGRKLACRVRLPWAAVEVFPLTCTEDNGGELFR